MTPKPIEAAYNKLKNLLVNANHDSIQFKIDLYRKNRIVIKYGGSIMLEKERQKTFFDDLSLLHKLNIPFIIVHGGGPIINEVMQKYNLEKKFIDGLRVTDKNTMKVTEMALSGIINKDIVNQLLLRDVSAVGISGKDGCLINAKKLKHPDQDLGFVGEILKVNPFLLNTLLNNNFTPVISPVSRNTESETLNINADTVASEIASAMNAYKMIFLTDVQGILQNGKVIPSLNISSILDLIKTKVIQGGMIPKVEAMIRCLENGVNSVNVIHGLEEHSIIKNLFDEEKIGTEILNEK